MISVCHIITTIEMGGAEKQLLELVREQTKSGDYVRVVFLKGEPHLKELFELSGAKVIEDISNKNFFYQIVKLRKLLRIFPADVVHAHLPRSELVARLLGRRTPYLVSRHNSENFFPGSPKKISRLLSRFVLRRSMYCICISKSVMQFLLESGELFEQTPIQVVYYGISQSRIDSFNKVQTDREDDSSTSFIVLCVARLVPQKNITILLEAFCKLVECSTQTELRIVGRGYLEPSLKMLSQRLGIESRVKWIQESRDIDILMKECDCLVLPSIYEGFGLVLLEAMNCELPIIASSIPTSREVLGEGYFGLFESNSSTSLFLKLKEFMDIGVRRNSLDWQKNRLRLFDIFVTTQEIRELYLKGLNSRGAVK